MVDCHVTFLITCTHGSAAQCCKAHIAFLYKQADFDQPPIPNPLTDSHQSVHDCRPQSRIFFKIRLAGEKLRRFIRLAEKSR